MNDVVMALSYDVVSLLSKISSSFVATPPPFYFYFYFYFLSLLLCDRSVFRCWGSFFILSF